MAVQLPDGATLERTSEVMKKAEEVIGKTLPEAKKYMSLAGLNIANLDRGSNGGTMFIQLEQKEERVKKKISLDDTVARLVDGFNREIPKPCFL